MCLRKGVSIFLITLYINLNIILLVSLPSFVIQHCPRKKKQLKLSYNIAMELYELFISPPPFCSDQLIQFMYI